MLAGHPPGMHVKTDHPDDTAGARRGRETCGVQHVRHMYVRLCTIPVRLRRASAFPTTAPPGRRFLVDFSGLRVVFPTFHPALDFPRKRRCRASGGLHAVHHTARSRTTTAMMAAFPALFSSPSCSSPRRPLTHLSLASHHQVRAVGLDRPVEHPPWPYDSLAPSQPGLAVGHGAFIRRGPPGARGGGRDIVRWPVPVRRRRSANRRTLPPVAGVWRSLTHFHTFPYNITIPALVAPYNVPVPSVVATFVSPPCGARDPCFFLY